MADPENGYTPIPNELLEHLPHSLTATETTVVYFIAKKTYGWNKKSDKISLKQFEKKINKGRKTIIRALKNLENMNILKIKRAKSNRVGNEINEYSLNLKYKKWKMKQVPQKTIKKTNI